MGVRRYRYFKTTLGVTYDTPPVLIKTYIKGLRRLIKEHPHTRKDNYMVHLHNMGDSALQIYFRTYLTIISFAEEMNVREELTFDILQLADRLGIRFAYPTQTLVVDKIPDKNVSKTEYDKSEKKLEELLDDFFEKKNKG